MKVALKVSECVVNVHFLSKNELANNRLPCFHPVLAAPHATLVFCPDQSSAVFERYIWAHFCGCALFVAVAGKACFQDHHQRKHFQRKVPVNSYRPFSQTVFDAVFFASHSTQSYKKSQNQNEISTWASFW